MAHRYCISVIATDPVQAKAGQSPPQIELLFFGPTAEQIVGAPVEALISTHGNQGGFLPT